MKSPDDLFNDPNFRKKLLKRIEEGWDFDKIEPMSTDEIFAKLNRLGITVTPDDYRAAAQRHESAQQLSKEWRVRYTVQPEGRYDEDFVWMAAIVLWKRLVPDRISFEQIDDLMQDGYKLLEVGNTIKACDAWWQVWEWFRDKVTPERNTLAAMDRDFLGMQSVFNWCQDFEMELGNAGIGDAKYYRLRISYCQEFLEAFSDIDWLMHGNFLRAEADSYWSLGEIETAEAKMESLIEANPNWAWGYIDWSDNYWLFRHSPKDYDKAEDILKRALARSDLEDRADVQDRLDRLQEERAQVRMQKQKPRKRRRRRRKR